MKEVLYVFVAIFLAELGDKTQLATIAFASKYGWAKAFVGAILGLALVNLIGAIIGEKIGEALPVELIHKGAGILFIIFGLLMFFGKI
ncbi:TMEM165/GDT1 family protein [Thermococcus sp. M39]|uniref:TMEM165/GDT1 family protein n=1 Tax=unclassified Thermococcus TaxID=2627626 RepID=UPI001439BF87|nr:MULTISPECIES: TMEM165/GDT1 family protein [unclassified Thermococcus]NJE08611.1 TMEM165/GDT1 family protein [Thermococcus sp. M39]NJE13218.1 TMEM165/GDT1 family protein [Thermococcus sp. LS2]